VDQRASFNRDLPSLHGRSEWNFLNGPAFFGWPNSQVVRRAAGFQRLADASQFPLQSILLGTIDIMLILSAASYLK
jgi:hypothetical protein